jgi:hypothetical protein
MLPDRIDFQGPYTLERMATHGYFFDAEVARRPGVYLWLLPHPSGDFVVNYVGKSKHTLAGRLEEHLWHLLGGRSLIRVPHCHENTHERYAWQPRSLGVTDFLTQLQSMHAAIKALLGAIRIVASHLPCDDAELMRIESGLIQVALHQSPETRHYLDNTSVSRRSAEYLHTAVALNLPVPVRPYGRSLMI